MTSYLGNFSKALDSKVKDMYHSRWLLSIRSASVDNAIFICGRVSAEMSKKVVYMVDVKVDSFGVVQEAQCECAAGMGPEAHCKHVSLVIYATTKHSTGITTQKTCTQSLQTFHQAKSYKGSPIKMENLQLRRDDKKLKQVLFDPRPIHRRNTLEYPHLFRNVWLNSAAEDIPIRQLYPPANIYAMNIDHDYLVKPMEDQFLAELGVTRLYNSARTELEVATRQQHSSKRWHHERLHRLHASNFGRICNLTDRCDKVKYASSLTVSVELNTPPVKHGRTYEPVAINQYEVEKAVEVSKSGIAVYQPLPFLASSPDGLVGADHIIEVKCPYTARDSMISPETVSYLYFTKKGKLQLKKNSHYYYQVMGTLMCTGRQWCDFIVWTKVDMKIISIRIDETFVYTMKSKLVTFFRSYFRQAVLDRFFYRSTDKYIFDA